MTIPLEHLRAISDPQRLAILRRLMTAPATLSQLGEHFSESAAHVRHHLKTLEENGLVELVETRPVRGFLEKYYRATAYAFTIHYTITPEERRSLVIGSMDYAIQRLAEKWAELQPDQLTLVYPMSSLDGLINLRQGICQMATSHLLDEETGEYNRPTVQRLFPGQAMLLIHLFEREEGLIVPAGNPQGITGIADLSRCELRIATREHGSGVRAWLDRALKLQGIGAENLTGRQVECHSHTEVARLIQSGAADVGVGIRAGAEANALDFIPLYAEPYDLVMREEDAADPRLAPFIDYLNSNPFQPELMRSTAMRGYHLLTGGIGVSHIPA